MHRKVESLPNIAGSIILAAGLVMCIPEASPAATHTWTGATSASWSVATNWSEGTAPAPGESNVVLVFPLGAARQTNTNNIAGLTVDSITVASASSPFYDISGNGLALNSALTFSNAGSGSYPQWSIPLTLGGNVQINNSGRMAEIRGAIDLGGHDLTFACINDIWNYGVISGSGRLIKASVGSLFLDAANTYSGWTMANAGKLYLANGAALGDTGVGTTLYATSTLGLWGGTFTSAEPITFDGGGVKESGEHTLSGAITLNANVDIDVANGPLTLSGPVGGTSGITKLGSTGILFLAGTSNYSGLTEVEQGDLCVTGSITSDVVITGSGARLMGSGSVGAISFTASGAVYPKVGGTPAVLTSNGGFTGMFGATLVIDITPSNYSRLVVNGPVNLNDIVLMQTLGSPASYPPYGQTYKLIENDGTDAVTGNFTSASSYAGLAEGSMDSCWGLEFNITYAGNTGNDVQMQLPLHRHAVASFDGDPADEAAVDFGADGIWLLNNGAWTQISPSNPEALIPGNVQASGGKEIVADLGTLGLWLWDGGAWANLTPANPENHAVSDLDGDGLDEILADLGSLGLWLWDGGAWNILSSVDVESVTPGDVDGDATAEVIADFGPVGLWLLDGNVWEQLSGVNADFVHAADLDMDSTAELAIDFGSLGLWTYDGGAWTQVSGLDPDYIGSGSILGPASRQLIGDFPSRGFWYRDGTVWNCLSIHSALFFICLDTDGLRGEDLFGDFYFWSLWQWDGLDWTMLSQLDPDFLAGGDLDGDGKKELLGDFGAATGLWLYDGGAWTKISDKNAQ
jgi:autotransporter-associated beta strand protein